MKKLFLMMLALLSMGAVSAQDSQAKFTSQSNADFAKTISKPKVQLVDVRTPAEFASGHIPGAVNMDVSGTEFENQTAKLDKKEPVAVYCRSGARSKTAARKLAEKGYIVYELDRGFSNWNGKTEKQP